MGYDPTPDASPEAALNVEQNNVEQNNVEQIDNVLVDLIAAYDEHLLRGTPPDSQLETALSVRAPGALSCLQLLARVFPRSSPAATAISGRRIARFELEREVGRGGFGVVYRARDATLNRTVALKVPHAHIVANPAARTRFLQEARAAAKLGHPNIVPVFESGEAEADLFLVTPYCEGPTLEQWIARNAPVAARTAAQILVQLAEAIQHSHASGIVHRDLKPANVLLPPIPKGNDPAPGELPFVPRITDFGLAKVVDASLGVTQPGDRIGTPLYMSPEQVGGRPDAVGPPTDIYALGAILYELLTGRPPFHAQTLAELYDQIRQRTPPSPSELVPDVPAELGTVALKCLEKSPENRYPTAGAVAQDLKSFLSGHTTRSETVAASKRPALPDRAPLQLLTAPAAIPPAAAFPRGVVVVATLLLVAAFALLAGGHTYYINTGEGALRFDCDEPSLVLEVRQQDRLVKEFTLSRLENAQALLKSGDYEITVSSKAGDFEITPPRARIRRNRTENVMIRRIRPRSEKVLGWSLETPTARALDRIAHHPTEPLLAYGTAQGIVRIVDSRTLKPVAFPQGQRSNVGRVLWSPDGTWLATGSIDKTVRLWTAQGEAGPVYNGEDGISDLTWSDDNSRLAIVERASGTVMLWNPRDGSSTRFVAHQAYTGILAWNPRRPLIAAAGVDDDHHRPIRIFHPDGKLFRELDAGSKNETLEGSGAMGWSPDGARLAIGYGNGTVRIWSEQGGLGEPTRAFERGNAIGDVAWTPDGTKVAVSSGPGIQFLSREGTLENAIPLDREEARCLAWDPGGQRLFVSGERLHQWTASGVAGLIAEPEAPQIDQVALGRQGTLAVSAGNDVFLWSLRGELRKVITEHSLPIRFLAWDPEGRRLATASFDRTVRVWNDDGSPTPFRARIEEGTGFVSWTPDGGHLMVSVENGPVRRFALDGALVSEWTLASRTHLGKVAWSPDGRRAAVLASRPRPGFVDRFDHIVPTFNADDSPGPVFDIHRPFELNNVVWTRDSTRLLLSGPYGRVLSWTPETDDIAVHSPMPAAIPEDERHAGALHSVRLSPDGKRFASSDSNGRVIVWTAEGERQATMNHDIGAGPLAWSDDSQRLAVGLNDGSIAVWMVGGSKLQTLSGHSNNVQYVAWSADGATLYSAEKGHSVRAWDAASGQAKWIAVICSRGRAAVLDEFGRLRYGSLDVMDQDFLIRVRTESGNRIVPYRAFLQKP